MHPPSHLVVLRRVLSTTVLAVVLIGLLAPAATAAVPPPANHFEELTALLAARGAERVAQAEADAAEDAKAAAEARAAAAAAEAEEAAEAAAAAKAEAKAAEAEAEAKAAAEAKAEADAKVEEEAQAAVQAQAAVAAAAPPVFATVARVELLAPVGANAVGFHESSHSRATPMVPVGSPSAVHTKRSILPPEIEGDTQYLVLPTRNRPKGPTTSADISIPHGVPVTSPVTGTIRRVSSYDLYGRIPDRRIEIVPEANPDLTVRMLHVEGVQVEAGQAVTAGETIVAASARQLPFESQIDRFVGAYPHIHVEVRR